jgi:hypothetical protein
MNLFDHAKQAATEAGSAPIHNLQLILDASPPGVGGVSPAIVSNWHLSSRASAFESLPKMLAQYLQIMDWLAFIGDAQGCTRGALEDATELTHQTLTSRVNGLERVGLVATLAGVSRFYEGTKRVQKVIVHQAYTNGRPVEPFRSKAEEKTNEIKRLRALCKAHGIDPGHPGLSLIHI